MYRGHAWGLLAAESQLLRRWRPMVSAPLADGVQAPRPTQHGSHCQGIEVKGLSIDGKRLRGIHGDAVPGVHLVAAFAHERGVVLGQQGIQLDENELAALTGLFDLVSLQGRVVTGDAQFTQRDVCEQIVKKGGTISS